MIAIITYRPDGQKKKGAIRDSLPTDVLKDICEKVTGQTRYSVIEDDTSYNKGRLVIIDYAGFRTYVTLSERKFEGRNSSVQSVPTALNIFCQDTYSKKQLCYYFLKHEGNAFTEYHLFMYRLMATAGIRFINASQFTHEITAFQNIDDLIYAKKVLRQTNKSNNSSFVTKTDSDVQSYAKVYGASKYESTLLAFATSRLVQGRKIDLYNIREKDLRRLPDSSLKTLSSLNICFHDTPLYFDVRHQNEQHIDELRSSAYIYNLLNRLGDKQCALCGCPVQEIVQGAHIWSVSDIKKSNLTEQEKFKAATSGDNGIWLCQNHHKLFDSNLIQIGNNGHVNTLTLLDNEDKAFIKSITHTTMLDKKVMSEEFVQYLGLRNARMRDSDYCTL